MMMIRRRQHYEWTQERDNWLIENAPTMTIKQLSNSLRINPYIIKKRCTHLGVQWKITPPGRKPAAWTPEEESELMRLIESGHSFRKASLILNKTNYMCERKYLALKRISSKKITITIEEILEMNLLEGQREMAISLFNKKPAWAVNYIKVIQAYSENNSENNTLNLDNEVQDAQR